MFHFQEAIKYRSEHPEEFPVAVRRQTHEDSFTENNLAENKCKSKTIKKNGLDNNRNKKNVKTGVVLPAAGSSSRTRNSHNRKRNSLLDKSSTPVQSPASAQDDPDPDQDWKSEFECPVCLEQMVTGVRIFQCGSGHVICGGCRHKMETDTCPTCRGVITGRATVMERLAAALL